MKRTGTGEAAAALTSLEKLLRENSSELMSALQAASLTWSLCSSFLMPLTMAVSM